MFQTKKALDEKVQYALEKNYADLAADLVREYYPLIPTMEEAFRTAGFTANFIQMNDYVWIVEATKI